MTQMEAILEGVEQLPKPFLDELADFVKFLKIRASEEKFATAALSESSLKKDWLGPEEEEAWRDL